MADEEVQEELVALEAIYMEHYARLSENQIRIIAHPEDIEDESRYLGTKFRRQTPENFMA